MLELERILKAAKSEITIYRAQELVKNMYVITYTLPKSKQTKRVYLGLALSECETWIISYKFHLFCSQLFVTLPLLGELTWHSEEKKTSLFCSSLVFS